MKKNKFSHLIMVWGVVSFLAAFPTIIFAAVEDIQMVPQSSKRIVKGKVLDESGEPLIGATVVVKGGANGVISNVQGEFSISVPEGKNTIEVSYIGYETQRMNVASKSSVVNMKTSGAVVEDILLRGTRSMKTI